MHIGRSSLCPYFKGSNDGAHCNVLQKLIKEITDSNIKLCMTSHYEACSVYASMLYKDSLAEQNI